MSLFDCLWRDDMDRSRTHSSGKRGTISWNAKRRCLQLCNNLSRTSYPIRAVWYVLLSHRTKRFVNLFIYKRIWFTKWNAAIKCRQNNSGVLTHHIETICYSSLFAEVVQRVMMRESPPFRPKFNNIVKQSDLPGLRQITERCWNEQPEARPDFEDLRRQIRKMSVGR